MIIDDSNLLLGEEQLLYITEISAAFYYRKGKRVIKKSLLGEDQAKP